MTHTNVLTTAIDNAVDSGRQGAFLDLRMKQFKNKYYYVKWSHGIRGGACLCKTLPFYVYLHNIVNETDNIRHECIRWFM
jgi:hypothetical protein